MKKWNKVWPFLGALALVALNTDVVVNNFLIWIGVRGHSFYLWLTAIASAELFFWFLFFRWLIFRRAKEKEAIREAIELSREAGITLKEEGFFQKIEHIFSKKISNAHNSMGIKALKYGGYLLFYMFLFGVAAEPFPVGRTITVILCSITNSRFGLFLVMIGNIIHIYTWNDVILKNVIWRVLTSP